MKRKIVYIDQEKCNGCGLCIPACHEGAIEIVDGKARLVEDKLCDGIGDCLGECPLDAIRIIEREADAFDEIAVKERMEKLQKPLGGCPGSRAMTIEKAKTVIEVSESTPLEMESELAQWPVQLTLVPPMAPYFREADLLIAADCVPLAFPEFHRKLLKGKAVVIGCPKLDDGTKYVDKLAQIIKFNNLKSVTIAHMEVPCCFGLIQIVNRAIEQAGVEVPVKMNNISLKGEIK